MLKKNFTPAYCTTTLLPLPRRRSPRRRALRGRTPVNGMPGNASPSASRAGHSGDTREGRGGVRPYRIVSFFTNHLISSWYCSSMDSKEVHKEIFICKAISLMVKEQQHRQLGHSGASADRPKNVPLTLSAADAALLGQGCWYLGILCKKFLPRIKQGYF